MPVPAMPESNPNVPLATKAAFEYEPLRRQSSLRLLKVLPRGTGRIEVELREQTEPVPYRCLSYTWGEPLPTKRINVNGRGSMKVSMNLYGFLRVAAQKFPHENLWIDAICINQQDNTEKGHQVQRIGNFYKEAAEVLIWFGNSKAIAEFFDWTCKPASLKQKLLRFLSLEHIRNRHRKGAQELVRHGYWTRAWIVQEYVFARSRRFLCGKSESNPILMQQYGMEKAVYNLLLDIDDFRPGFWFDLYSRSWSIMDPVFDFFSTASTLSRQRLSQREKFHSLTDFVLPERRCLEPRDRIYSMLAIVDAVDFEVNYSESTLSTFWRAAEYFSLWWDASLLWILWESLDLSSVGYTRATEIEEIPPLQFSVTRVGRPPSVLEFRMAKDDIALYPCEASMDSEYHYVPWFVLRFHDRECDGPLSIGVYLSTHWWSGVVIIEGAELWASTNGEEVQVLQRDDLSCTINSESQHQNQDQDPKEDPSAGNLILRLPPLFVIILVSIYSDATGDLQRLKKEIQSLDPTFEDSSLKYLIEPAW